MLAFHKLAKTIIDRAEGAHMVNERQSQVLTRVEVILREIRLTFWQKHLHQDVTVERIWKCLETDVGEFSKLNDT